MIPVLLGIGAALLLSGCGKKRIPFAPNTNGPDNTSATLSWEGLRYDKNMGPQQAVKYFLFKPPAVYVGKGDKAYLTIGTNNANLADGVAFQFPDGTWTTDNALVSIQSITVYDMSLPAGHNEVPGLGSALIGKTLVDIRKGGLVIELPVNPNQTILFAVAIRLTANTGDFLPGPAAARCSIITSVTTG